MSYKITKADIDAAEAYGACAPAIDWLRAAPRTIEDLYNHNIHWAQSSALLHPSLPDEARIELYALTKCISYWRDGKRHRDGGLPALESSGGSKFYYENGVLHRDGGLPACEWASFAKEYYKNGVQYFPNK